MVRSAHRFADARAMASAWDAAQPRAVDVIGAELGGYCVNALWAGEIPAAWQASMIAPELAPRFWPEPTPAFLLAEAVNGLVEQAARSMNYNSAAHCAGYAVSTVPQWRAEAEAFIAWRDAVLLVVTGLDPDNPPPSVEAALALLPPFERPAP